MLDIEIAYYTPEINAPGKTPAIAFGPKQIPTTNGVIMTNNAGGIISLNEAKNPFKFFLIILSIYILIYMLLKLQYINYNLLKYLKIVKYII